MCIQMNGFYVASRRAPDYLSVGCGAIVRVVHLGESFMLPSVQSCFSCKWAARWWWCRCSVMMVIRSENKNGLNWQGSRRLIMQTHLKGRWGCEWLLKGPKQNQGEESQKKPEFKFWRNWAYCQSRRFILFSRIVESTRRSSPESNTICGYLRWLRLRARGFHCWSSLSWLLL